MKRGRGRGMDRSKKLKGGKFPGLFGVTPKKTESDVQPAKAGKLSGRAKKRLEKMPL